MYPAEREIKKKYQRIFDLQFFEIDFEDQITLFYVFDCKSENFNSERLISKESLPKIKRNRRVYWNFDDVD